MKCKLCEQFYKDYPLQEERSILENVGIGRKFHKSEHGLSSPVRCAFGKGMFSTDNWNCQTMVRLRELCGEGEGESNKKLNAFYQRYEDESIGVLPMLSAGFGFEGDVQEGFLVMSWYKSRGRTGQANIWCNLQTEVLTLKTAEAITEKYKDE